MTTVHEALRQLVEVCKLVDFADCAERPELWNKFNAVQQVAEEVLKMPEQEPVSYIAPRLLESLAISRECAKVPSNWSVAVQAGQRNPEDLPLYAAPQPAAAPSGDVERERDRYKALVAATQEAILKYYDALSARKHGTVAQHDAFSAIEYAFGMYWDPNVDHRAAITATKE